MRVIVFKRTREVLTCILLVALSAVYSVLVHTGSIEALAPSQKELPVYSVDTADKVVAFTIDTAQAEDTFDAMMELFNRYDMKVTFFVTGKWALKYPHRAKQVVDNGHELGNHSNSHPYMTKLSDEEMVKEMNDATDAFERVTGQRTQIFRPPYGDYDSRVIKVCRAAGYQVVQWDVDSIDWQNRSVENIMERVNKKVQNGSILLFHSNAPQILKSIPAVAEDLISKGYRFVKVSELVLFGDYEIDHTGRQFKKLPAGQ